MLRALKILTFSIILTCSNLFSKSITDSDKNIQKIISFYKEKLKNVKNLEISFIKESKSFPYKAYIFEFKTDKEKTKEIVFVDKNYFFTDFVSLDNFEMSKEKFQSILENENQLEIKKELKNDQEIVISLGRGKNTIYTFSDPECPFCKKHLKTIDDDFLKKNTIKFIFTSVHNNFKIIASLYKKLDKAQTEKEQLEIIKKFYFENPTYENVSTKEEEKYKKIFEKYLNLGVTYTPFII